MAVGKTTLIKGLLHGIPEASALYESDESVQALFDRIWKGEETSYCRDLKQLMFICERIQRIRSQSGRLLFLDGGIEDYFVYWRRSCELHFPDRNPDYIDKVRDDTRAYASDRIYYLTAAESLLRQRKAQDTSRRRNFFETYMRDYWEYERQYFLSLGACVIDTGNRTTDEVRGWVMNNLQQDGFI
jgi:hypothetical protein